jgi:hypothetical protein
VPLTMSASYRGFADGGLDLQGDVNGPEQLGLAEWLLNAAEEPSGDDAFGVAPQVLAGEALGQQFRVAQFRRQLAVEVVGDTPDRGRSSQDA